MSRRYREPQRCDYDTDEEYEEACDVYEDALEAREEMRRERLRDRDR